MHGSSVHLPLMLNVLSLNMGSGVGNSVAKHAPLMSFAKMTLKCVDLWLQIGTGGPFLFVCVCVFKSFFFGGGGEWRGRGGFPCSG